ncbi:MAG: efflux RND transporter periplasmic adaptor subunit, partial [Gemmatimonadetes bacterium]|nr:efflux RND transporter periplasmic adaptor subunit [Gemmatimonadota bacterium]
LSSRGQVEITSGLAVGDVVVITGNNALRDGANVRVVAGPGAATESRAANTGENRGRGQ